MNLFKNKYVMIGLTFAGGILLYSVIKKFTSKEEDKVDTSPTPVIPPTSTPITPVSGTADNILNNIDEKQAEDLKNELK
tara:strand:+ start:2351 stop:2587 length:237 start_codon:yes stop_codon:yes gene_type:complete